jgi:hypothetical protein
MSQVARNLSDAAEGFLIKKRYLIHDVTKRRPHQGLKQQVPDSREEPHRPAASGIVTCCVG